MKVLGVFLLLQLFSQVGFAGQQYLGTQAKKIILAGAEFESDLTIVPIHSGDTVTTENVRTSIQALYDTGHYEYIEVDADSSNDGTVLTFRVRPYHFFSTFRIEPRNLLSTPLSTYVRLPVGEKFSQTQVDRIAKQTEELFESEGYFKAVITPEVQFDESTDLTTVTLNATVKARARISTIEFLGDTKTIPEKDLRDELGLKTGSEFSAEKLDSGVAKIRSKFTSLGFLNGHVESDRNYNESTNTVSLTAHVEPGPSVHVEVLGYAIPDKKLREIVPVFEEGAVDPDLVDEGRAGIRRLLQENGYYDAAVEAMIIHAPDNAVQIRYTVGKGDRYRIDTIHFEGNEFFTTDAIHTRLKSRTDVFSPDILNQDLETIRSMYKTAGFDGTAVESAISETDHAMDIVISIKEGRRYTMDSIAFVGNHDVPEAELRNKAALKPEQIYTPSAIEQTRTALTSLYYAKGYPDAHVEQDVVRSPNKTGIELTFRIDEGQSYKIGRVLVEGNTRTKEKIILRNSKLYPGSPYDPEVILQAQQKLYATGLFNRVDIVTLPQGLQGVRNILIQVEDASPLTVIYGVGYQDIDGPRATVEVSHNNLFGLDRPVTVRVVESKNDQLFRSTLRDPQLFNHDIEGDLSAYIEHTIQPQFNADRVDFSATALKRASPHVNLLFTAGFQKINLLDILLNPLADAFPDETGIVHIARIGSTVVYDKRNDPINPRTGMFQTATVQLADRAFGSEFNFTSFFDQYIRYKPAGPGVIAFSLRFGWKHPFGGTTDLPITERYFAGGSTTLRGFGLYEAGPIGGGDAMTIGNLEYRFPLPLFYLKSLGGAVFYDTGNVFTSLSAFRLGDFTHSVGFGLRYQTPLGPVRTDVGFDLHPTVRSDGTTPKVFHAFFTLGHTF